MCDQLWVAVIKDLKRQMRTMKKSENELCRKEQMFWEHRLFLFNVICFFAI